RPTPLPEWDRRRGPLDARRREDARGVPGPWQGGTAPPGIRDGFTGGAAHHGAAGRPWRGCAPAYDRGQPAARGQHRAALPAPWAAAPRPDPGREPRPLSRRGEV